MSRAAPILGASSPVVIGQGAAPPLKWRPIPSFEAYEISEDGDIRRRLPGGSPIAKVGRPITPNRWGPYDRVSLRSGNRSVWCAVHRLVLLTFVGQPPTAEHMAAHNDGNCRNNHYTNLRWATPKENSDDMVRHGTRCRGSDSPNARYTEQQIVAIRDLADRGAPQEVIAAALGTSQSLISRIVRREAWAHLT